MLDVSLYSYPLSHRFELNGFLTEKTSMFNLHTQKFDQTTEFYRPADISYRL